MFPLLHFTVSFLVTSSFLHRREPILISHAGDSYVTLGRIESQGPTNKNELAWVCSILYKLHESLGILYAWSSVISGVLDENVVFPGLWFVYFYVRQN